MRTRIGRLVLVVAAAAAVLALATASAGAATKLKFFQKGESQSLTDSSGHPITDPNAMPAAGDRIDLTDRDFVGNHKRHAKHYTATDHLVCTFTTATEALCNGQFAIGGSLLLAEDVNVNLDFSKPTIVVPITGGTGVFQHVKGTVTSTQLKSGASDVVISLHG
jgi:hypothetical protein